MVERGGEGRGTGWRRRRGERDGLEEEERWTGSEEAVCKREGGGERERGLPGVRREEELSPRGFKPVEFRQWCLWV